MHRSVQVTSGIAPPRVPTVAHGLLAPPATEHPAFAPRTSSANTGPVRPLPPKPATRWAALAAFALLGLYAVMAWTASLAKGLSFDEGLQLAVGYNIWTNHDLRIEGANGDFIKRWATLPYLITRPRFVGADDKFWKAGAPYELAYRFFFESGNRPESLLKHARAMATLLGVAAGLLVFWCSREVFGSGGALISLALFAFSPHMLAFGGIVSTDMSITLALFGGTWCIWRLLHEVTVARALMSLAFMGLMVLAKPTALVILPVTAILLIVRLISGRALVIRWHGERWFIAGRRGQMALFAGLIVLHALAGWSAIWAHYEFRYTASPIAADDSLQTLKLTDADETPPVLARMLQWTEQTRFLPEGYRNGIELLLGNDDEIGSFMNGRWTIGGRPLFFPYAMWVKTQPVLFLLLVIAATSAWSARRAVRQKKPDSGSAPRVFYALTPYLALIVCYFAIALTEDLNIGHRHILPIYPCLYLLAGAVGLAWAKRAWWVKVSVGAALAWLVQDSVAMRPHYLAYFGPQAGGPDNGYRHLVDSSLDWGMNLPGLRRWLDEQDLDQSEPLFLAYFGSDSPAYHGIQCRRLPGFFDRREVEPYALTPGYYAISATLLQSVYTMAYGPWSRAYETRYRIALHNVQIFEQSSADPVRHATFLKNFEPGFWENELDIYDQLRFARLCAWLRRKDEPLDHVGHAILIWKLSDSDLEAALLGPPVELTDDPLPSRQFRRFHALRD
jgi:hypothetical protein